MESGQLIVNMDIAVIHVALVRDRDLIPDLVSELVARRRCIRRLAILHRCNAQRLLLL